MRYSTSRHSKKVNSAKNSEDQSPIIIEEAQDVINAQFYVAMGTNGDGYELIRENDLPDLIDYLDITGCWVMSDKEGRRSVRVWSKKTGKFTDNYSECSWYPLVLVKYPNDVEWLTVKNVPRELRRPIKKKI